MGGVPLCSPILLIPTYVTETPLGATLYIKVCSPLHLNESQLSLPVPWYAEGYQPTPTKLPPPPPPPIRAPPLKINFS